MNNYSIDRILEEKKITDFLADNGIHPVKMAGGKYMYRCPIHSGDNDPSFVVYPVGTKGRNYQTYHCFGCHSGINIINLKMDLDNLSAKEAIQSFLKDVHVDIVEVLDANAFAAIDGMRGEDAKKDDSDKSIELLMLALNFRCRSYLEEYGDEEEVKFFDEVFYKKVDEIALSKDVDTLDAYYNMLMDKEVLVNRAEAIRQRKEEEEVSASEWII